MSADSPSPSPREHYAPILDNESGHFIASGASSPLAGTPRSSRALLVPGSSMRQDSVSTSFSRAGSTTSLNSERYRHETVINRYALPTDPRQWQTFDSGPEADDILHNPGKELRSSGIFSWRGLANLGCLLLLVVGIITLFAGYPMITYFTRQTATNTTTTTTNLNLRTNATGDIPSMKGKWRMIDDDTPSDAYTRTSYTDGSTELQLVFSDEFNTDGRTFYPGDDPFWEAVDLHYWQTVDLEWYDPAAITTKDGALEITFESKETHGLQYQGGMMTTWNNFCFTGGIVEVAVQLPGSPTISGFWPAVWTMGNLGRVGYGASTDGLWPYSYDACDVGTVKNQTYNGQPVIPVGMGDQYNNDAFSYLPGQRLSRCTCSDDTSHPGPKHSDGSFVGRAAPEIDLFEATASTSGGGKLSQSAQYAPFNYGYYFLNGTGTYKVYDSDVTAVNSYHGGAYQEAISAISTGNQTCYQAVSDCYATYGIEYQPGFDTSYITWMSNGSPTWTLYAAALAADTNVQIAQRPVSQEPMYLIMNLGMSTSFQTVSDALQLPGKMRVDYVRVYQRSDSINTGCDPKDYPTMDYIAKYNDAYTNPNYTLWTDIGESFPGNSWEGQC